ncbi:MAG TPA: DUF1810 domain-containing protein [Caulobacteraceae bacterium]|jgi:uncharacterized protein (DUF1810 family)
MRDPFALDRFLAAQEPVFATALGELEAGRKASHWMWFIFPQIEGLGSSPMACRYAIASLDEARAYLAHPVLGPRLMRCVEALLGHDGLTARQIMGSPDDIKLRSSLTLFARAAPGAVVFAEALERFFAGEADPLTLAKVERAD